MVELLNAQLTKEEASIFNVITFEGAFIEFDEKPYAVIMYYYFDK